MIRCVRLLVAALIASACFGSAALVRADSGPGSGGDVVPDEVVVKLARAEDVQSVAVEYRLDPVPLARFGAQPIFRMRIIDGVEPVKRAQALVQDVRVIYAEPNYFGEAPRDRQDASWASGFGSLDLVTSQWANEKLGLQRAQRLSRGAGVTVAVLDTGIDASHPLLADHLVSGYDFVDLDADPAEQSGGSAFGHGTHVAGLIATVAPEARIMPLRVLDANGVGNIWVLAEALQYAIDPDGNPATDDGVQVVNLSISTTHRTRLLHDLLESVSGSVRLGPVVVAAAGNAGTTTPEYPAAENQDGLLAVGASTRSDGLAPFSNRGSWVHVIAPGVGIASSVPGGRFAAWSGTSMSAALVSGEAALVRSKQPQLGARTVARRIIETATRLEGGSPRIDLTAALSASRTSSN